MTIIITDSKTNAAGCSITPLSPDLAENPKPRIPCTFENSTLNEQIFNTLQPTPLAQTLFTEPMLNDTLSDEDRSMILSIAHKWNGNKTIQYQRGECSNKKIDCSNLVAKIYAEAGFPYPYTPSGGDWDTAGFERIDLLQAKPGDVIRWNGHVGIVIDPEQQTFLAISSTATHDPIRISSYAEGTHWGKQNFEILQFQIGKA